MKTTSNILLSLFLILALISGCSSAKSQSTSDENQTIMILSQELQAVLEHLSGTLSVYDEAGNLVETKEVSFSEDNEGNVVVSSPTFTLKKSMTYRFLLIFFWDDIPIAYVDTTQATDNDDNTTINFTEEMLIYAPLPDFSGDLPPGTPDLDLDGDGWSNLIELRSGSDPNDPNSIPSGPTISNFTAFISGGGNLLTIAAEINDGNGVTDIILSFEGAEYLIYATTETINGSSGNKTRTYEATLNPQHAPIGNLTISLTAKNAIELETTKKDSVIVTDNGQNVGPVIAFENPSIEGQSIDGIINITMSAYDRDGITDLTLTSPSGLTDTSPVSNHFSAVWNTTFISNGEITLRATATDASADNKESISTLSVSVSNNVDINGPDISIKIYEQGNAAAVINYENGETVYGIIQFEVEAVDPNGVASLFPSPSSFLTNILGDPIVDEGSIYIGTLDTTSEELIDGGSYFLKFTARDPNGYETTISPSITIGNQPSIETFTADGQTDSLIVKSGDLVTFNWSTTIANNISLTNTTTNQTNENLNEDGSLDLAIPLSGGTYQLRAERETNVAQEFVAIKEIVVQIDDDSDGHPSIASGGDDCDDNNALIYPGAPEFIDDVDNNCDGSATVIQLNSAHYKFTGETNGDEAGYSIANAGDVDGDGTDDILIGARFAGGTGKAYLIYGSNSLSNINLDSADVIFTGETNGDEAGAAVAGAGDVNNDGCDDILIGAPQYDVTSNEGKVYLIYGRGSSCSYTDDLIDEIGLNMIGSGPSDYEGATFAGESSGDQAGYSVGSAGDFTGNGYGNILIGAPFSDSNDGKAYLIYGGTTNSWANLENNLLGDFNLSSVSDHNDQNDALRGNDLSGDGTGEQYGLRVAGGNDFNNDGYTDIMMAAPFNDGTGNDVGKVYIILGGTHATSFGRPDQQISTYDWRFFGGSENDYAGSGMAAIGDFNGDGSYDDLAIGDYGHSNFAGDQQNAGKTYLFYGGEPYAGQGGDPLSANLEFYGELQDDNSGRALASVGQVNNDSTDDLLIGAPYSDAGGINSGETYLILGDAYNNGSYLLGALNIVGGIQGFTFVGEAIDDVSGSALAGGDFDGDGFSDVLIGAPATGSLTSPGKTYLILSGF